MKIVKKVSIGFLSVLLGLLFIFNIYSFISLKILKNDLSSIFGYAVLEVVSGSMEPTIHVGDLIIIQKNETDFKANDIVTFYDKEGAFVTHRIISIDDQELITKGDANESNDEALPRSSIVGKYVMRIPFLGLLLTSLKNPFILFMIFLLGVLICYFLSLDKDGKIVLTEEEKEYEEFLNYQKDKKNKIGLAEESKKQEDIEKSKKLVKANSSKTQAKNKTKILKEKKENLNNENVHLTKNNKKDNEKKDLKKKSSSSKTSHTATNKKTNNHKNVSKKTTSKKKQK